MLMWCNAARDDVVSPPFPIKFKQLIAWLALLAKRIVWLFGSKIDRVNKFVRLRTLVSLAKGMLLTE